MLEAVNTLRHIDLQQVLGPTFDAVNDRRDGIPTRASWAKAIGVGRQFGFPRRFQGLADQRLPRPFLEGWHAQRPLFRAPACGYPGASKRGGCAVETPLVSEPYSLGRCERCHPIEARGVRSPVLLGDTTPRQPPGIPGLAQQVVELVYGSDLFTWRGSVRSFLEAEDMPLDLLPREVLPGHHQGLAILCVGSWPLTHGCPFPNTGPTSAYPGRYPWRWLLRASSSPVACGWPLLREVTASQRAAGGSSVPRCHACLRRTVLSTGCIGGADRSVCKAAGAVSCAMLAPARPPLALGPTHDGLAPLRWRCPSMPARRETRIEASRLRR
jgi:hypothetical protein